MCKAMQKRNAETFKFKFIYEFNLLFYRHTPHGDIIFSKQNINLENVIFKNNLFMQN